MEFVLDANNNFNVNLEFNKLLVPSPIAVYNEAGELQGYAQPDISFLKGIFESFNDALTVSVKNSKKLHGPWEWNIFFKIHCASYRIFQ